jgi:beta-N-acetylhexosaminidase
LPTGAPPQITQQPVETAATVSPAPDSSASPQTESLETRIGQMLLVGFRGLTIAPEHPIVADIRDRSLGGVVLFDYDVPSDSPERNIASPQQVKELVAALQSYARTPLLIAIDQEGGLITRLKERYGFPATLSAQQLGALDDPALTRRRASEMAAVLAGLGINLNLAPVIDLNSNPDNPVIGRLERSFGADPAVVTDQAIAFIQGHHEHGVRCTLKHFPGHGSSAGDTHLGVVDVTASWSRTELEPYDAIIRAGLADAIMTAHVFNAQLDPDYPATLSAPTISGLLRQELRYGGAVICDDIQMGAIRQQFGFEDALRRVIEAGVDIITIANNTIWEDGVGERAVSIIHGLVQQGVISEARIDQSYARIQRLKASLGVRSAAPA